MPVSWLFRQVEGKALKAITTRPLYFGAHLFLLGCLTASPVAAGTTGALYNMDHMLREAHPFTRPYVPSTPAPTSPAIVRAPVVAAPPAIATPPRLQAQVPQVRQPARAVPAASPGSAVPSAGSSALGIFSELRGGVLAHDFGPFSHRKEEGVDINAEVLFISPDFMDIIWSPRPTVGGSFNSSGDTSQAYMGLTWEWDFLEQAFFSFFWGGAVHNGEKNANVPDKKDLGCRVLFRESIDLGWRFTGNHALMVHFDHISNAKICDENEGLESLGLRYGYRF